MPSISAELFERLLYEGESDALDFKREQYGFIGASDEQKGELLKDILAFANSWRRVDAYIVLGAEEVKGARCHVVGVASHIDDAQLQQFVNSKVQRPIHFAYSALRIENKDVALIHIPLQGRPFYLTRNFGRLAANAVYIRRGSSTDTALPDEVARMGRGETSLGEIALDVFFADPATRTRVSPTVQSTVLVGPVKSEIPDYRASRAAYIPGMINTNSAYYRDLVSFTVTNLLLSPVHLAVRNAGSVTAHDLRLEIIVAVGEAGVTVMDDQDFPSVPRREFELGAVRWASQTRELDVYAERVQAAWLIHARAAKVQPEATAWLRDPIYVGARRSTIVVFDVTAFADNLSTPHHQSLRVPVEARSETATLDRIEAIEAERFASSAEYRAFMREHGPQDSSDTANGT